MKAMTESSNASPPKKRKRRRVPKTTSPVKSAALAGLAGIGGAAATLAADRIVKAAETGITNAAHKVAEKHFNKKPDGSWERAAQNVQ